MIAIVLALIAWGLLSLLAVGVIVVVMRRAARQERHQRLLAKEEPRKIFEPTRAPLLHHVNGTAPKKSKHADRIAGLLKRTVRS